MVVECLIGCTIWILGDGCLRLINQSNWRWYGIIESDWVVWLICVVSIFSSRLM